MVNGSNRCNKADDCPKQCITKGVNHNEVCERFQKFVERENDIIGNLDVEVSDDEAAGYDVWLPLSELIADKFNGLIKLLDGLTHFIISLFLSTFVWGGVLSGSVVLYFLLFK